MKKYDIAKQAKIINVSIGALMLIAGVLIAVFSGLSDTTVKLIIGCMFIITGAGKLLGYFSNDLYKLAFQFDLAIGALDVIIGVLTIALQMNIYPTIATGVGVYVSLDSLLKVQTGLDARRFGMKNWLGMLISSAAIVSFGVFALIVSQTSLPINIAVGIALAADAVQNIWITMYTVRVRAKKKNFKVDFDIDGEDGKQA